MNTELESRIIGRAGGEGQMVKRKCVKPLRHFCLKSLPLLVAGHVRYVFISQFGITSNIFRVGLVMELSYVTM